MTTTTDTLRRDLERLKNGTVKAVVAGTGIAVDATDPERPVVSTTGGGGGSVDSVTGDGSTTTVDATDPANPIVSAQLALDAAESYADAGDATTLASADAYTDASVTAAIAAAEAAYAKKANNLSDLADATDARTNLGLGTAATHDVPASGDAAAGEVVLGNDSRLGGGGVTYTDTGITVVGGAKAGDIIDPSLISAESSSISVGEYAYPDGGTTWQLWVYPTPASGTFELDVRKKTFANSVPGSGDSICASAKPALTGDGLTLTATGDLSTWTDSPLGKGDQFTVVPTSNTAGVKWWALYIPARRTF